MKHLPEWLNGEVQNLSISQEIHSSSLFIYDALCCRFSQGTPPAIFSLYLQDMPIEYVKAHYYMYMGIWFTKFISLSLRIENA